MNTAKVIRITTDTAFAQVMIVAGIQLVGGTAITSLYNNTTAIAGDKKAAITSPVYQAFDTPIRFDSLFVDLGAGVTEAFIHTV